MKQKIVIATRGSRLAQVQSEWVRAELLRNWPDLEVELKLVKTEGDRLQTEQPVQGESLEKGLFTKEIEQTLLKGEAHIAVHSCKDLPTGGTPGLALGAMPKRVSARDILILKEGVSIEALPEGAMILTGSPRRQRQWLDRFPATQTGPIRGNVDTRVRKLLENPEWTGLILAEAGLTRLKWKPEGVTIHPIPFEWMLPAPGQGALYIQIRADDAATRSLLSPLHDPATALQVEVERSFLAAMGGGCLAPLAAFASVENRHILRLAAYHASENGGPGMRHELLGKAEHPEDLGRLMAERFLNGAA